MQKFEHFEVCTYVYVIISIFIILLNDYCFKTLKIYFYKNKVIISMFIQHPTSLVAEQ